MGATPQAGPPPVVVVSTNYVPGCRITRTVGFTWGLIVRVRGLGGNVIAALRTLPGGEIKARNPVCSKGHAIIKASHAGV